MMRGREGAIFDVDAIRFDAKSLREVGSCR